jgi:transposase
MSERIIIHLSASVRFDLESTFHETRDARLQKRLHIILLYADGFGSTSIARILHCAPATAVRVARAFLDHGMEGLLDGRRDNGMSKVDDDLLQALAELLQQCPQDHGWRRPTWTRELLAQALQRVTGVTVSVRTIGRMMNQLGARWGAGRPTLKCPWSEERKQSRLKEIRRLTENLPPDEKVFYEDEVDIHLNPRIGRDWMLKNEQKEVLTPGQNKKNYIAGAMEKGGPDLVWVKSDRKNTDLFLDLLDKLQSTYPEARRIHLILDNYVIHSSRRAEDYIEFADGRIVLHFLPPYTPDENKIERLWRDLHSNVTRNHRCRDMQQLMREVTYYLAKKRRQRKRKAQRQRGTKQQRRAA